MDPALAALLTGLADVTARNTAATIYDKLRAVKSGKANQEAVNQLSEIIDGLIEDKNELVRIGRALEEKLVAERVSDEEIRYVTTTVIPTIETFLAAQSGEENSKSQDGGVGGSAGDSSPAQALAQFKTLVSPEMLTVLQLLGFNYREAIGEPLTAVCRRAILSVVPDVNVGEELALVQSKTQLAALEVAQNNADFKRYKEIGGTL